MSQDFETRLNILRAPPDYDYDKLINRLCSLIEIKKVHVQEVIKKMEENSAYCRVTVILDAELRPHVLHRIKSTRLNYFGDLLPIVVNEKLYCNAEVKIEKWKFDLVNELYDEKYGEGEFFDLLDDLECTCHNETLNCIICGPFSNLLRFEDVCNEILGLDCEDSAGNETSEEIADDDEADEFQNYEEEAHDELCSICLGELADDRTKILSACQHTFHKTCIELWFETSQTCPLCNHFYGNLDTQPVGDFCWDVDETLTLPGFDVGTIRIFYDIPAGKLGDVSYAGTVKREFLPNLRQGRRVRDMLELAWDKKLILRLSHGRIVWNTQISHKTNLQAGQNDHSYPDAYFLDRIETQLKNLGI